MDFGGRRVVESVGGHRDLRLERQDLEPLEEVVRQRVRRRRLCRQRLGQDAAHQGDVDRMEAGSTPCGPCA